MHWNRIYYNASCANSQIAKVHITHKKTPKDDRERCILLLAGAGLQEIKRQDKAGKDRHRIHPHMLRHSFAVWSLDGGVPVGDLQAQLGHDYLATTGIYLKGSPNHRRGRIWGLSCLGSLKETDERMNELEWLLLSRSIFPYKVSNNRIFPGKPHLLDFRINFRCSYRIAF